MRGKKVMFRWWDGKWKWVLFLIILPLLLLPLIGVLFFPQMSVMMFFGYGLVGSSIIASTLKLVRTFEILGLRIVILVLGVFAIGVVFVIFFRNF